MGDNDAIMNTDNNEVYKRENISQCGAIMIKKAKYTKQEVASGG